MNPAINSAATVTIDPMPRDLAPTPPSPPPPIPAPEGAVWTGWSTPARTSPP